MGAIGNRIAAGAGLGIINTGLSLGISAFDNWLAQKRESEARKENYMYGEMAAENADARTRSLYNTFYTPSAQMKLIKEAGLSPSLLASEGAGVGGTGQAGAMGNGASGISPNIFGVDPLAIAQMSKLQAETDQIKEETAGIKTDNKIKEIIHSLKQIEFELYDIDYTALTDYVVVNGKRQSLYEFAGTFSSYERFIKELRNMGMADKLTNTEQGQKALRQIFIANRDFKTQIAVLSEEETGANFQTAILNALKSKDFAELNAESAIGFLRKNIATNELTESQKDAWNDLLNKLGEKGSTTRDIAIILGMIINNFAHGMHYTNVSKSYNITK